MPRETKAQRLERQAKEMAEKQAEEKESFFPRLMHFLERASNVKMKITVYDGKFVVTDGTDGDYCSTKPISIGAEYNEENSIALDALQTKVHYTEASVQEEERIQKIKRDALTKLTLEEKEILGLIFK